MQDLMLGNYIDVDESRLQGDPEYRLELLRTITRITIESVTLGAKVVLAMVENGDDRPKDIPKVWWDALLKVGEGRCSAELYVALQGDRRLLSSAMNYSTVDQDRLVRNESYEVVVVTPGGRFDLQKMAPSDMTNAQRRQVFAPDEIRGQREQIAWIQSERTKKFIKQSPKKEDSIPLVRVDRRRKGIIVESVFLSRRELLRYAAELD